MASNFLEVGVDSAETHCSGQQPLTALTAPAPLNCWLSFESNGPSATFAVDESLSVSVTPPAEFTVRACS